LRLLGKAYTYLRMDINQPQAGVAIVGPNAGQNLDIEKVLIWGPDEVSQWLYKIGAEIAIPHFRNHLIQGRDLPLISKDDMRYMQVPGGAILRISGQLEGLSLQKQQLDDKKVIGLRMKVIKTWNHFYGYCACMCCRTKRSYVLTGSTLAVIDTSPFFGGVHRTAIDLSSINDVDEIKIGFTCTQICCGAFGYVDVNTNNDGLFHIAIPKDESTTLFRLLSETWELARLQMTGKRAI